LRCRLELPWDSRLRRYGRNATGRERREGSVTGYAADFHLNFSRALE
jgi:hypothetical protein